VFHDKTLCHRIFTITTGRPWASLSQPRSRDKQMINEHRDDQRYRPLRKVVEGMKLGSNISSRGIQYFFTQPIAIAEKVTP
jgi:hypothetical protein